MSILTTRQGSGVQFTQVFVVFILTIYSLQYIFIIILCHRTFYIPRTRPANITLAKVLHGDFKVLIKLKENLKKKMI